MGISFMDHTGLTALPSQEHPLHKPASSPISRWWSTCESMGSGSPCRGRDCPRFLWPAAQPTRTPCVGSRRLARRMVLATRRRSSDSQGSLRRRSYALWRWCSSHLPPGPIDLSTQVDDVVGEIKWKDLDGIVLVGHSYGGMVITQVAEQLRDRISAIVYLGAFLPADGQSLLDITHTTPCRRSLRFRRIPPPTFMVNAADSAWVDSKLTPHPTGCFTEKL